MKNTILIALLVITSLGFAQNNFFTPDTNANQLFVNGFGGVSSSAIPQSFINKFLYGGFIDTELKDNASGKLKDNNLFGGEVNINAHVYLKPGSFGENGFFGIGMGYTTEGALNFTNDLFNLVFYGNKQYAGETLNLNNTAFNSYSYSYLDFTMGKTLKKDKKVMSGWVDVGLVLGHNFSVFDLEKASIFTQQNGDYLDITIENGSISANDSLSTNFIQGIGAKANLNFAYNTESTTLLVSAKNLGGISWSSTTTADLDTTLRFEGIEIEDIFELSDSVLNEVTSLDSLLDTKKEGKFAALPIDLNLYYKRNFGKFTVDGMFRHRLLTSFFPYFRVGGYWNGLPIVKPGITVAYGGYGGLQAGLNAELKFIDNLNILIGTNNLLGAIVPDSFTSMDAFVGVRMSL